MIRRILTAALALAASTCVAAAHGGGGGGGGHGGHGGGFIIVGGGGVAVAGPPPAQVGDYSAIHTVAIISAIGQSLQIDRHLGLFNNVSKRIDITDWKLDARASTDLRYWLGSRFIIKDVPYDAAALDKILSGPTETYVADLQKYLSALPHNGVDAYILLRPAAGSTGMQAFGIKTQSSSAGPMPVVEWANYEIDIVNANTLMKLGSCYARAQTRSGPGPFFAIFVGSKTLDPGDSMTLTTAQRTTLHAHFDFVMDNSIRETLRPMGLGIAIPFPADRKLVAITPDKDPWTKIKTVAVISAVGDSIEFGPGDKSVLPVADWNEDAAVETLVRNGIAKRFEVKAVTMDRAALAQVRLLDDQGAWKKTLDGLPPSPGVDAYILVLKHPWKIGSFDAKGAGLGLWNDRTTRLYAHYAIAVIDAHTSRILLAQVGMMSPKYFVPEPIQVVSNGLWVSDPSSTTPEHLAMIRSDFDALMTDSVPETLQRLELTGLMEDQPADMPSLQENADPAAPAPPGAQNPQAAAQPAAAAAPAN